MFSGAAIILSVLGEIVVASHSVAISIASLFFMVPLAIGLASSTRVGNLIGEKNPYQAKIAATSTILLCISGALLNSIIIISFGSFIVGLYTTEVPVLELAISLILFAAIFQLPDGIQMGALGSLRGYKDTFIPMILLMIRRPPRSTRSRSSAASDVYKRQSLMFFKLLLKICLSYTSPSPRDLVLSRMPSSA